MRTKKLSESEPYDEASKSWDDVKMGAYSLTQISIAEICLLVMRHPALRRQQFSSGHFRERGNLTQNVKGKDNKGNLGAESTDV